MKIIYDNIIFSLQRAGGISLYWSELIKRVQSKKLEIIFYEKENNNIFRKLLLLQADNESFLDFRVLRYFPFLKKLPAKAIFHSSYYRTTLQKDVLKIVTVHDFTYEFYRIGIARWMHSWQKNIAIKNSDGVICVSNNTKKDLFKFLPEVDKNKVRTIYISAGEEFFPLDNIKFKIQNSKFESFKDKKIILYVGDRKSSYKNFSMAVDVVRKLSDCILVSVGAGELTCKEKNTLELKLGNRYAHFLGIGSEDLNIIYNLSFCLLYPSSYEGFGVPVLESMHSGCPVVSTNYSSIPEVAGDAGLLVDNILVENFINAIKKLEDHDYRKNLIQKGLVQAQKFTWNKCFEETIDFYNEIHERKFGK